MIRKIIDWLKFIPLFILGKNIFKDMKPDEWDYYHEHY